MDTDFITSPGFKVLCLWSLSLLFAVNFNFYGMVLILAKLIACPISYATDPSQSGVMLYPTIKVKLVHKSPDNPQSINYMSFLKN